MLFILHRVGIVILSTKTTVTLVPVDMMKMNTINLNFPSPRSEPREVIEVGSVHKHVKVLMILILVTNRTGYAGPINIFANSIPITRCCFGTNANKIRKSVQIKRVNTFLN